MARRFVVKIGFMMQPKILEGEVTPTDDPRWLYVQLDGDRYPTDKIQPVHVHETRHAAVEDAKKLTVKKIEQCRRELKRLIALRDQWTKELKQKAGA